MFTQAQILKWSIEFDREATARAYVGLSVGCNCANCRNLLAAFQSLPVEYTEFLKQFGVEPLKPAEIVEYSPNPDGTHYYGWWYHIVGTITTSHEGLLQLESGIEIEIRDRHDVLAADFPRPVIQMEFFANLPWVLAEKA
jgi:hypothetical protein